MKCPHCGEPDTKVYDTRVVDDGVAIRRRRQCETCQSKFTTYERLDAFPMTVIKRSGRRELFDRNKILDGVLRSCNKRPVSAEQIEALVAGIESTFYASGKREIESGEIGELVMERLKGLDEVSYVRFASVYKQFRDIDTFMSELSTLLREKEDGK